MIRIEIKQPNSGPGWALLPFTAFYLMSGDGITLLHSQLKIFHIVFCTGL